MINDFLEQKGLDIIDKREFIINLPKSDVLQFFLKDGTKISVRPSGTEPKIKFYFEVNEPLPSIDVYDKISEQLNLKIHNIITGMELS